MTNEKVTTSDEVKNALRILKQVRRLLKVLTIYKDVLRRLQLMRRLTKVLKDCNI